MKATSLFKSLIACKIDPKGKQHPFSAITKDPDFDVFGYEAGDPGGQQWESMGLQSGVFGFAENEFFRDIDGKGVLCFVRLSKRALPARVVRERVDAMAADIFAQTGRKPGRKERRGLQDDATMELLPKAFINHVTIPVIFTSDKLMLVFTSTPKRFESIVNFFLRVFSDIEFTLTHYPTPDAISPVAWMTGKAVSLRTGDEEEQRFTATDFAVMKGDEMGVIRVKDRELGCAEVAQALKSGYRIEQIGLMHHETKASFRLNTGLALTQIALGDDVLGELRENMGEGGANEVHATAWLVITEYRKMLADLAVEMTTPADDEL